MGCYVVPKRFGDLEGGLNLRVSMSEILSAELKDGDIVKRLSFGSTVSNRTG